MSGFRPHLFRLFAAVAVCAAGLSAPSTADASCGDYLYQGHSRSMDFSPREQAEDPPNPQPCRGPGCRNAPEQPPRSVPVSAPVRTDNLLSVLAAPIVETPAESTNSPAGESPHPPAGHPRRIDRPPRAAV